MRIFTSNSIVTLNNDIAIVITLPLTLATTAPPFIITVIATAIIIAFLFYILSLISGLVIEGESGAGGEKRHSGSSLFSLDSIPQGKACFYGAMTSLLVIWEKRFVCLKLREGEVRGRDKARGRRVEKWWRENGGGKEGEENERAETRRIAKGSDMENSDK